MRIILLVLAGLLAQSLGAQSYTGKSYALFFANNDYSGNPEFNSLRNPIKDAEAIAKELREMYGYTEVKVLKDLTKQEIFNELGRWHNRRFQAHDQLFVFFSGHGSFWEFTKKGYYAPKTNSGDYSAYIELTDLANIVTQIPAPHILLCIDACYSGTIDQEIAFKGRDFNRPGVTAQSERDILLSKLLRNKTRLVLTSGGKERTPDGTDHSPLAKAILNALRGAYSHGDGLLTYTELLGKMERVSPIPHHGDFPGHEQGNFVFIAKTAVTQPGTTESPSRGSSTPSDNREAWGDPATGDVWGGKTTSNPIPDPIQQLRNNMVRVEGGSFIMGCLEGRDTDCFEFEKPPHVVQVSGFSIGKFEVTQAQWRAVMGSDPSWNNGCDNCPVEQVSWNDVQEFIQKLNALTGERYRLPTEAEWEYAARGGNKSKGYLYSGSNIIDKVAWYDSNAKSDNEHGSQKTTRPVGGKNPNELGLYDMSGNVWEWCADDWHGSYKGAPTDGRAWVDSPRSSRYVGRGGCWTYNAQGCRAAYRGNYPLTDPFTYVGFRLAL